MDLKNMFWEASIDELKRGYVTKGDAHVCLVCGKAYEEGVIYTMDGRMMEASKAVSEHINTEHGSMMDFLLGMDKKYTGLTERQKQLIRMFYSGMSDKEIVKKEDINASTIRTQRFSLREKFKQARIFLVIMELMEASMKRPEPSSHEELAHIHRTATNVDERYAITKAEKEKVMKTYFNTEGGLTLESFPKKQKRKIVILDKIAAHFKKGKRYTEKEVNAVLKPIYPDYVTIRRYLIEYGFLARTKDGSEYWLEM